MKSMVLQKQLVAFAIIVGSGVTANAMQMPAQVACQTPQGLFPMPNGMPMPGAPCGNGMVHGLTVLLPQGGQMPQLPGPSGMPFPTPPGPGAMHPHHPMGGPGQIAGMLGANREMQLAAECSAAGHPKAVAACIAGRLTSEELAKCSSGIGAPDGCFGPNNTIRIHVENAIGDLTKGPGRGHDILGEDGFTCDKLGICF